MSIPRLSPSPVSEAFPHIQWLAGTGHHHHHSPYGFGYDGSQSVAAAASAAAAASSTYHLSRPELVVLQNAEDNPLEYTLASIDDAFCYVRVLLKVLDQVTSSSSGSSGRSNTFAVASGKRTESPSSFGYSTTAATTSSNYYDHHHRRRRSQHSSSSDNRSPLHPYHRHSNNSVPYDDNNNIHHHHHDEEDNFYFSVSMLPLQPTPIFDEITAMEVLEMDPCGVLTHYCITKLYEIVCTIIEDENQQGRTKSPHRQQQQQQSKLDLITLFYDPHNTIQLIDDVWHPLLRICQHNCTISNNNNNNNGINNPSSSRMSSSSTRNDQVVDDEFAQRGASFILAHVLCAGCQLSQQQQPSQQSSSDRSHHHRFHSHHGHSADDLLLPPLLSSPIIKDDHNIIEEKKSGSHSFNNDEDDDGNSDGKDSDRGNFFFPYSPRGSPTTSYDNEGLVHSSNNSNNTTTTTSVFPDYPHDTTTNSQATTLLPTQQHCSSSLSASSASDVSTAIMEKLQLLIQWVTSRLQSTWSSSPSSSSSHAHLTGRQRTTTTTISSSSSSSPSSSSLGVVTPTIMVLATNRTARILFDQAGGIGYISRHLRHYMTTHQIRRRRQHPYHHHQYVLGGTETAAINNHHQYDNHDLAAKFVEQYGQQIGDLTNAVSTSISTLAGTVATAVATSSDRRGVGGGTSFSTSSLPLSSSSPSLRRSSSFAMGNNSFHESITNKLNEFTANIQDLGMSLGGPSTGASLNLKREVELTDVTPLTRHASSKDLECGGNASSSIHESPSSSPSPRRRRSARPVSSNSQSTSNKSISISGGSPSRTEQGSPGYYNHNSPQFQSSTTGGMISPSLPNSGYMMQQQQQQRQKHDTTTSQATSSRRSYLRSLSSSLSTSASSSSSSISSSVQQLYELIFMLWCMTLDSNTDVHMNGRNLGSQVQHGSNFQNHFVRDGAIVALVQLLNSAPREKVLRLALSSLKNLATSSIEGSDDHDNNHSPNGRNGAIGHPTEITSTAETIGAYKTNPIIREMIACGILKSLEFLQLRQWNDEDLRDDLYSLMELLRSYFDNHLTHWKVYETQLEAGRFTWSSMLHTESFLQRNIRNFEGPNGTFEPLQFLLGILARRGKKLSSSTSSSSLPYVNLTSSSSMTNKSFYHLESEFIADDDDEEDVDDDEMEERYETISICLFDLGEFSRLYPNGRMIVKQFGAKNLAMRYINHRRSEIQHEALLCVSKMLVHNWRAIGGIHGQDLSPSSSSSS